MRLRERVKVGYEAVTATGAWINRESQRRAVRAAVETMQGTEGEIGRTISGVLDGD